jgi:transposase
LREGFAPRDIEIADAMYLRHTTIHKHGKAHTYWRLVRSVRRNGKVVQETVANLGSLDARGRVRARDLAERMMGRPQQRELFEEPLSDGERVAIRVNAVRTERPRRFGDVWLGWTLWRMLKLDQACSELLVQGREEVEWATVASILAIARFCEPSSELHIAEDWYRRTALDDMLGVPSEKINEDRLYRAHDVLLPHKTAIERHLRERLGELFKLDYDLLLYDVTSTYFEGEAKSNALAARGYSRDHRPDCKQVCIALVVTRDGMPLGYELFAGNRVDVTTVEQVVTTMETRYGKANRVWVMDRGMVSAKNIEWLQQGDRRYVIATPKSELKKWREQIVTKADWQTVREGIEVKACAGPDGQETFLLCRSAQRREKERAMHQRFLERIEQQLRKIEERLATVKRRVNRARLERQLGRLMQRNSRAASRYQADLVDDETRSSKLRLGWTVRELWDEWAEYSEGCYILRTNVCEWTPDALWKTYIQLSEAEEAFRIHKTDLRIRPIWHHKTDRVAAHIFVCFLAYVMWKTLEQWQRQAGLGDSPRTIVEEIARIQTADVVLPTAENPPRELRVRCVVRPDKSQAELLDRLGLRLPERLRALPPTADV